MNDPNLPYLDEGFLPTDRVILHADCNNFFASVESIEHPEYKQVPMAVCGDPKSRHGIILAKNELAKAYHVQTAETLGSALRKCPQLLLVPSHYEKYQTVCEQINAIYESYTDLVERFSIDESSLDVTGSRHLFGTGRQIADALRRRIREEIGITISVGVSFNKTFAKMGSEYKKPDATTLISRANYKSLLWPLPVGELLFVGHAGAGVLRTHGIYTIGDLAHADTAFILAVLGKSGLSLQRAARGEENAPVRPAGAYDPPKSIGHSVTFDHDLLDSHEVLAGLSLLSDQVCTRLRRHKLFASVVQIQIKDPQLKLINRQRKLEGFTSSTRAIRDVAVKLWRENWPEGKPIRMLTVSVTGLREDGQEQLDLFSSGEKKEQTGKLDAVMDNIRAKYGPDALTLGRHL